MENTRVYGTRTQEIEIVRQSSVRVMIAATEYNPFVFIARLSPGHNGILGSHILTYSILSVEVW